MNGLNMQEALSKLLLEGHAQKNFLNLYKKFCEGLSRIDDWDSVKTPDEKFLVPRSSLKNPDSEEVQRDLAKVAVCKLNGGLGTSMGCQSPKSTIIVREEQIFSGSHCRSIV